jgi:hypothetical protein
MTRPLAGVLLVVAVVVGALAVWRGSPAPSNPAPPAAHNPGGYVASDVGLLAATGRPQVVEVFHYG